MEKYKRLRNAINKWCRKSKEAYLDNKCTTINEQLKSGRMDQCIKNYCTHCDKRIENTVYIQLNNNQFGFRRQRGTREALLWLRQVMEKQNKKIKPMFIAFVDLEKAFDNVK